MLDEIQQFRMRVEEEFKLAEKARKDAESEGLFAFNAKKNCEEHATTISQIKGSIESDANAVRIAKQQSDDILAFLTTNKATIDSNSMYINDQKKEADSAVSNISNTKLAIDAFLLDTEKNKNQSAEMNAKIVETLTLSKELQCEIETCKTKSEKWSEEANSNAQRINGMHEDSTKQCIEIETLLKTSKENETSLQSVLSHLKESDVTASNHEIRVNTLTAELEKLFLRVDSLLPMATSASLASSFREQKKRFTSPQKQWFWTFIICIGVLVIIALPSFFAAVVRIPVYSAPDSCVIRHPDPEQSDALVKV